MTWQRHVGLNELGGVLQPKWFCDLWSMMENYQIFLWYYKVLYDQWNSGNEATATGLEIRTEHRTEHFEWEYIFFQSFCLDPYHKIKLEFFILTDVKPAGVATLSGTAVPKKTLKMISRNQVWSSSAQFSWSLVQYFWVW